MREDQKRRKADLNDPTYVLEVPEVGKNKSNKKTYTASKKTSAGDSLGVVSFVFMFFSIQFIYYLISI